MSRCHWTSFWTAVLAATWVGTGDLFAQQDAGSGAGSGRALPAVGAAARIQDPPTIDGDLSEAAWRSAGALSDFVQREPNDGAPATEKTEVRVLFDEDAIYVAVWAWDSNPEGILPGESVRDYEVSDADAVLMIFDTFNDQQNGFVFGTTPAGIEYDGQVASQGSGGGFFLGGGGNTRRRFQAGAGGGFNKNWDGSWTVAASRDDRGWYAEFRIPFSTLRYGADNQAWGFNVSRRIRRLNQEVFWSTVPRAFSLYRLDYAGQLSGIEPPFRRSATATPYLLGGAQRDYGDPLQSGFDQTGQVGGEAKVQLTQGLTLDLTYNTDFAQVEVDDQQVNLTRFSLLFPEKRPFFLENAGFFAVGGGSADLFFSRRIGISDGKPVPITGGGRLSGRAAGFNVGLLHIQTGKDQPGDASNAYSVARVARELPSRSRVGALFVDRRSSIDGDFNRTYAVDARAGLGENLTVSSFLAKTETPGLSGAETAWDVTAGWNSRSFRGNLTAREIGENFNPEVGFLPRDGHRYYQVFALWAYRPESVLREIRPHASYYTYRSLRTGVRSGLNESSRLHIDSHWEWPSGMELHTGANYVQEGLYEPFTIYGTDVEVPVGNYGGWESQIVFFTDQSRKLSLNSRFNWGGYLSGNKRTSTGDITLRPTAKASLALRVSHNDVMLPQGEFTTVLAGANLAYFFTPRIYLQSLIQYSDQIDTWSANVRFGWLNTAGTGLFVVYNDVQGIGDITGPVGRSLFLKFTRQINLFGTGS